MSIAIVYGSLREGAYNYDAFKRYYPDGYNKIGQTTIQGYDLHSLGAYPFIVEGEGELVVDIMECSSDCFRAINGMELGAGYLAKKIEVELNGEVIEGTIYTYPPKDVKYSQEHVKSGDWIKYKNGEE